MRQVGKLTQLNNDSLTEGLNCLMRQNDERTAQHANSGQDLNITHGQDTLEQIHQYYHLGSNTRREVSFHRRGKYENSSPFRTLSEGFSHRCANANGRLQEELDPRRIRHPQNRSFRSGGYAGLPRSGPNRPFQWWTSFRTPNRCQWCDAGKDLCLGRK